MSRWSWTSTAVTTGWKRSEGLFLPQRALFREEGLQDLAAFGFENARRHKGLVV